MELGDHCLQPCHLGDRVGMCERGFGGQYAFELRRFLILPRLEIRFGGEDEGARSSFNSCHGDVDLPFDINRLHPFRCRLGFHHAPDQLRARERHQQITVTLGVASGGSGEGDGERLELLLGERLAERLAEDDALCEGL